MKLHILPSRTEGAAGNMAVDFLLLQRYPEAAAPRFRHYEWRGPAFTFGFSQKIAVVRELVAADHPVDLCRRPTGGGLVDHRHDWTYALVLPRGHVLYDARATASYRSVHECLAGALVALGQPAELKTDDESSGTGADLPAEAGAKAGVCFQRAELYDVINSRTGAKIAGAAQKRNKHGMLFQGSIEKNSLGPVDWEEFQARFTAALAQMLGGEAAVVPWPDLHEDEVAGLIERYSAPEWLEYR